MSNNVFDGDVHFKENEGMHVNTFIVFLLPFLLLFFSACNKEKDLLSVKPNELKKSSYDISQCKKKSYTLDDLKSYELLID
uniref:hypothetical protein n=1 Tax=Sulfurimonas sp. TaxID=2022749 RepID=UPI003D145B61